MKFRFSRFAPALTFAVTLGFSGAANAGFVWSAGAETTYDQGEWGADVQNTAAQTLLEADYTTVYSATFFKLVVGGTSR